MISYSFHFSLIKYLSRHPEPGMVQNAEEAKKVATGPDLEKKTENYHP
jgi:hypothetical protein